MRKPAMTATAVRSAAPTANSSRERPAPGEPVDAPDDLVGYRLRRVHGHFVESWRAFFGELGLAITPVQAGILMQIARHPRVTQTELAGLLDIETPTLHESVKRLLGGGLIHRESLPHDRRSHALVLTPSGKETTNLVLARIAEQEAAALAALSSQERRQLASLLGRVLAARGG